MSDSVKHVREFRGGLLDGRVEPIQPAAAGDAHVKFGNDGRASIYRKVDVGYEAPGCVYHFYEFVKSVAREESVAALDEVQKEIIREREERQREE
jgi:hypothetical protein